jgi:hypothetical protein
MSPSMARLWDLGHHIVEGLAVAEGLVDRRVEAVQEAELELIGHSKKYFRALKLSVTSSTSCRDLGSSRPAGTPSGSFVRKYWFFAAKSKNGDRARYIRGELGKVELDLSGAR